MIKKLMTTKLIAICTILIAFSMNAFCFPLQGKIVKEKLHNGLRVLLVQRTLSPTVSLYIRYRVGAVDEAKGKSGAAHFLEHMMFKGTTSIGTKNFTAEKILLAKIEKTGRALDQEKKKGSRANRKIIDQLSRRLAHLQAEHKKLILPNEIDRLYTENGGLDMNAATGSDLTTYHVSLPANKIELWARIESDRLLNPVFREFYTERDVVMEERRQRVESDPEGKLYESLMSTAFKKHPYRRPILGYPDDLMNLTPEDIRKIQQQYQNPQNIVIAVVGDIDIQKTLNLIEKYFGHLAIQKGEKSVIPVEPEQTRERRVEVKFAANPSLIMGFHKPNAPSYNDYVFDVLETILTTGRTSRLYQKLVIESQIAKNVSAVNGIPGSRYPNLFAISAQPRHPHTNKEVEQALLQEIEKIKNESVSDEELTQAKNNIKMYSLRSLDSNADIASTLSYYEVLLGDYRYFADYMKNIEKVTPEDIQKAAREYLHQNNRTTAVLHQQP